MPRNITVTLANGTTHTYANTPDDVTPDQVSARAQKEFGVGVTAIDGGRGRPGAAAPKPNAPAAQPAPDRWNKIPKAKALQIYENGQQSLLRTLGNATPEARAKALTRFNSDPRMQRIREVAGLAPVSTREDAIQAIARANVVRGREQMKKLTGRDGNPNEAAMASSTARAMFGIPERLSAAARYYGGMGGPSNRGRTYDETLDITRAENNNVMQGGNTASNVMGTVVGSIAGGGPVGGLVRGVGRRLAATGAPVIARAGNVLEGLATLKKGQRLANTAKVVTAGASGGGAQALGEGSDVGTGVLVGAAAPLVLGGAVKSAQALGKLARAGTRPFSRNTAKAIQEVVTEAPEAVAARHADLSARTGENVPVVAALNDRDFAAVADKVLKKAPEASDIAKGHTGKYLRSFMDRMLGHVNQAGRRGDAQITSIGELSQLRRDTADDLMRPIQSRTVDLTQLPLDDLERQMTKQIGGRIAGLGPRINEALKDLHPDDLAGMGLDASDIANARKLMTQWGMGTPVQATVREMDALRRSLDAAGKSSMQSNPANSMAFRNAAKAIREFVSGEVPAYGQMVDTYAAQSRMMEGFETAAGGKRMTDIADDTLRGNLRTPEGRVGMKAGELFRQREAVTAKPTSAINAARDYAAAGKLTRPASLEPGAAQPGTITENLGDQAAAGLRDASGAETQVLGRMLDVDKLNTLAKNEDGALSPEEIVYGAFLGNALASTKVRFLTSLIEKLPHGFNKKVASNMADMLFSRDAAATAKAMAALNKAGFTKTAVSKLMSNSLPLSEMAGRIAASEDVGAGESIPEGEAPSVMDDLGEGEPSGDVPSVEDDLAGMETPEVGGDSPYAAQLQEVYDTEDPALLDLIGRVEAQESGGNQSAVSSAGAIGVMQVMPDTAPEAAQLAGLPWDENAYRTDENYNRLLGIAYLSQMLRRYDGDVEHALAAYNAGPGRVDDALAGGGDWLSALPAETQDYVAKIA